MCLLPAGTWRQGPWSQLGATCPRGFQSCSTPACQDSLRPVGWYKRSEHWHLFRTCDTRTRHTTAHSAAGSEAKKCARRCRHSLTARSTSKNLSWAKWKRTFDIGNCIINQGKQFPIYTWSWWSWNCFVISSYQGSSQLVSSTPIFWWKRDC